MVEVTGRGIIPRPVALIKQEYGLGLEIVRKDRVHHPDCGSGIGEGAHANLVLFTFELLDISHLRHLLCVRHAAVLRIQ